MAEHKEKKHKEKSESSEGLHIAEIIFGIVILLYFLTLIGRFIGKHSGGSDAMGTDNGGISGGFIDTISGAFGNFFAGIFPTIQFISIFLSLLLFMGIIYASFKFHHLKKMHELHEHKEKAERLNTEETMGNPKWKRVLEHVDSTNPSDWRLAILEADILLGDMLTKMGYHGEGIGEQLKAVEKSDFNTIDNAWEAHKIRNAIAHEGADFIISQREAQRVINLFQSVFEEFHFS